MSKDDSRVESSKELDTFEEDYEPRGHIFHDLMSFKVREILLVSSLYDAFVLEEEGLIPELVIGEYAHLHLSSPPRVTRVSSGKKALTDVTKRPYDLIITMSKNIGMDPFDFGKRMKESYPELPVILLATDTSDLHRTPQNDYEKGIDKVFFWNGDSSLFLAIIKYIEDRVNVRYDTVNGNVRVLIMVEDSVRYYSMFLPIIYTEIMGQTQRLISEELNEMQGLQRMRGRPKILLAETFEEGMVLYNLYRKYVLGIISDVRFKRDGKMDSKAGYKFIRLIKKETKHLPVLLQSSTPENREKAESVGAYFLHKHSPSLLQDFRYFLENHLGFGDFIFVLPKEETTGVAGGRKSDKIRKGDDERELAGGSGVDEPMEMKDLLYDSTVEIGRAPDMREFEQMLRELPFESIKFHAKRNHFSNWLMARGEFKLAMKLRPRKVSDFTDPDEIRKYLIKVFNQRRRKKHLAVISDFPQQTFEFESSFTRLGTGSLGGKGRGIAFMRVLLARYNLQKKYKSVRIAVPSSVVICTDEFDSFISDNDLHEFTKTDDMDDHEIAQAFLRGSISEKLKDNLRRLLQHFRSPLAVRSSSLLEDSQNHPFAGIYSTYLLPNNHEDDEVRLRQLCQAIKLVYASVFFKEPRSYIEATSSTIEEEKMAIIIQELVGEERGGRFYPDFSGVAQSYNFYPVSHQTHEDGIASVAVGLGKTVVGGEKVLRFSPPHPSIIPEFSTASLVVKNSQSKLYVLNTVEKDFELSEKDDTTLKKLDITEIKDDSSLESLASTYDQNDGVIRDSIYHEGPRLITFAGILKYDAFPLAALLQDILKMGQNGMGGAMEIEFAVNLAHENGEKSTFAVLQIRSLGSSYDRCEIVWDKNMPNEDVFLHSIRTLGNGVIDTVQDIVYVPPKIFDSSKTTEIATEVGKMNQELVASSSPYLLMGPGRWGTQDRWLGIPVTWDQISGARVMVEIALEEFNIEPSQGTHFFQNIITRKIGYITMSLSSKDSFIDWKWLGRWKPRKEMGFVRHVRLPSPLTIKLDGRCGRALITKPERSENG